MPLAAPLQQPRPTNLPGAVGHLHSVETGAAADGPGVRFVYFLSGCSFRCLYCHNPDTWEFAGGRLVTLDDALDEIRPYVSFLRRAGGVTLSGGDPLTQTPFARDLLAALHDDFKLHTALDTQGYLGHRADDAFLDTVDLTLLDIKHADPERHRMLTGRPLGPTLAFAERLARLGKRMWIRHVLVPGWTDSAEELNRLADWIAPLGEAVERVDVLPYHRLGVHKWMDLGRAYPLGDIEAPTPDAVNQAVSLLRMRGLNAQ